MGLRKGDMIMNTKEQKPQTELSSEQVQDIVKKRKRNRPDLDKFGEENTEPGDNARYLRHALVSWNLPAIDISDPKQVEKRITDYFQYCIDNDRKPNIKGLGNWLGVSDETVMNWRKGVYREDTHLGLIKKAIDVLQELWWDYGQNGKSNPASWIFIGKNAFGMRDETQVTIAPSTPLDNLDSSEARKRLSEAIPDDD